MARSTLPALPVDVVTTVVIGGVDTHLDVHVAAALNQIGGLLGTASFPTTPRGYGQLIDWLAGFGPVVMVGVEGTSSYGAGLTRALEAEGVGVVEVDRPNRQDRRRVGKSDTLEAIAAARAGVAGEAVGLPRAAEGRVAGQRPWGGPSAGVGGRSVGAKLDTGAAWCRGRGRGTGVLRRGAGAPRAASTTGRGESGRASLAFAGARG